MVDYSTKNVFFTSATSHQMALLSSCLCLFLNKLLSFLFKSDMLAEIHNQISLLTIINEIRSNESATFISGIL